MVIPGKRSATRNPGFSSNSGFRRLPRTRSGVRRNDGLSDFCKNLKSFKIFGLLPKPNDLYHKTMSVSGKMASKKAKNAFSCHSGEPRIESGAGAGIRAPFQIVINPPDSGFHRGDDFLRDHQERTTKKAKWAIICIFIFFPFSPLRHSPRSLSLLSPVFRRGFPIPS